LILRFTVDFTILLLKSTISNGKINSETVKSTNVRSKIILCTKSLIIRKKNRSVPAQFPYKIALLTKNDEALAAVPLCWRTKIK
jgi:hypothetical protein